MTRFHFCSVTDEVVAVGSDMTVNGARMATDAIAVFACSYSPKRAQLKSQVSQLYRPVGLISEDLGPTSHAQSDSSTNSWRAEHSLLFYSSPRRTNP